MKRGFFLTWMKQQPVANPNAENLCSEIWQRLAQNKLDGDQLIGNDFALVEAIIGRRIFCDVGGIQADHCFQHKCDQLN